MGFAGGSRGTESGRTGGEILTRHPSIVPSATGRAVGSVPMLLARKQIPVGYWESVTPPDHTQSEGLHEDRESERESGCAFMLFRSCGRGTEMWLQSRGERK